MKQDCSRQYTAMSLLSWKTEYSVGVMSVDDEHRELIHLINALYERMDARSSASEIEHNLGDIYKVISAHFGSEERLMQAANYDQYSDHKHDHDKLLNQLNDMMDEFVADPAKGSSRIRAEMSNWFMHHFANHDARLHGKLGV